MIASEVAPWAKTGGLADVLGALPDALDRLGHRTTRRPAAVSRRSILPPGRARDPARPRRRADARRRASRARTSRQRRRVVFVDVPALFDRDGFYGERRPRLPGQRRALRAARDRRARLRPHRRRERVARHRPRARLAGGARAGAAARRSGALAARSRRPGSCSRFTTSRIRASSRATSCRRSACRGTSFTLDRGEFWGQFSFLKAGITYERPRRRPSARPTRARRRRREFGAGFEGVLRARGDRYVGILNGIDTRTSGIRQPIRCCRRTSTPSDLAGKARVQARAARRVSACRSGDDALARPLDRDGLAARRRRRGSTLIEAGQRRRWWRSTRPGCSSGPGEPRYERFLRALAARHPSRVGALIGFDEALAHLVEAGADIFLMPSMFEPCGLNQMYSLRYGTVPIVRAVGGLDDTIQPYTARARHANGFKFSERDAATRWCGRCGRRCGCITIATAWRRLHAARHGGGSLMGRRRPGNMSKCTDGLGAMRPAERAAAARATEKGTDERDGFRTRADIYRRQFRRRRAEGGHAGPGGFLGGVVRPVPRDGAGDQRRRRRLRRQGRGRQAERRRQPRASRCATWCAAFRR